MTSLEMLKRHKSKDGRDVVLLDFDPFLNLFFGVYGVFDSRSVSVSAKPGRWRDEGSNTLNIALDIVTIEKGGRSDG